MVDGATRTFAGTVELANSAIEQYGIPSTDTKIVDLNTNTVYNLDGSIYRSAPAPTEQLYNVRWTDESGDHDVNRRAANADAAMADVRANLERSGFRITSIEANPIGSNTGDSTPVPGSTMDRARQRAQGSESLPAGNARWLILDRNDQEIYSFVNTTAQRDANLYASDWISRNRETVSNRGPFTVVPVSR